MDLYLSVLIGAIVYGFIDYVSDNSNEVFTKKYLLTTLANIAAGAALLWMLKLNEAELTFNSFDFARLIAGAFGVFGQKLFKAAIKVADKNIKTKLNITK